MKKPKKGWVKGWRREHPSGGYVARRLEGSFVAILSRDGVRKTKAFPSQGEAMEYLSGLASLRDGAGEVVSRLSAVRLEQAAKAVAVLEEAGMEGVSLVKAAEEYASNHRREGQGWAVEEAARRMFAAMAEQARPRTIQSKRNRLTLFLAQYGGTLVRRITREDVEGFLDGNGWQGLNRRNYALPIQSLFNFCEKEMGGGFKNEVAKFVQRKKKEVEPASIIKPGDAANLLKWMEENPFGAERPSGSMAVLSLAFGFFAGMRTAEICNRKFNWSCINLEEGTVMVPASVSKTRKFRQVPILPPLRAFIEKHRREQDEGERKIALSESKYREARRIACAAIGIEFPQNAARHSFATYRAKMTSYFDAASEIGHRGGIGVFQDHYQGLCSKAEAEQFFSIRPL